MIETAAKIVSCFVSGMSGSLSRSGDRQFVSRHVEEALDVIRALRIEHFFTITLSDDNSMLIGGVRMPLDTPEARRLFLKLRQKGVNTIVISKGVRADEIQRFLADLSSLGDFFHSYAHIAVKRSEQPRSEMLPAGRRPKNELLQIKRIYRSVSVYKAIDMTIVDAVVGNLIADVRKEGSLPALLAPAKEDGDDLYVHSLKVALLSILQGEQLGLGNALLYDIGLAALLHDVGKTLLPHSILENQDSLSEAEWTVMRRHPEYGAALLASLNKIPEIAITVAYEHHRRYDGTGYPEVWRRPRKQHIISQIVAVSDFYSAASAGVPHRKPLGHTSIMGLLLETAGREFNRLLVDNFVRAMEGYSATLA